MSLRSFTRSRVLLAGSSLVAALVVACSEGGNGAGGEDAPTDAGARVDAGAEPIEPADAGVEPAPAPDAAPLDGEPIPNIEGFGRATVGGWQTDHDTIVVTSLDDSGPGTLREALTTATKARVVSFGVDGAIELVSPLLVPSNLSIDGRGRKIVVRGKGFILAGSDDVIIENIALENVGPSSEDGIRIGAPVGGPSERIVVDHVRFTATGNLGDSANVDEAISIVFGSRDITLSWLRFEGWEKVLLIGNGDAPADVDGNITVSMHHVWAKNTGRRHPQARHGIVDVWNVFLDDWHMFDWAYLEPFRESFGVQAQDSARIRFESSLSRRTPHEKDPLSQANDLSRCESGGKIDSVDIVLTSDSTAPLVQESGCTNGPTGWSRPYPATVEVANGTLRTRLETETGNTL